MNTFTSKFSLYETLRILIPGFYLTGYGVKLLESSNVSEIQNLDIINVIIFVAVSISVGVMIYSLDIPKKINFFQKDLPTKQIEKKHPAFNMREIENSYFTFYNHYPKEALVKNEIYSGLYHYSINMAFSSFLIVVVYLLMNCFCIYNKDIVFNIFFCVLNSVAGLVIYFTRLRYAFQRQLEGYYLSEEYNKFKERNP